MLILMAPLVFVLAFRDYGAARLDVVGIIALILALCRRRVGLGIVGTYMLTGNGGGHVRQRSSVRSALVSPLMLRVYGVVAVVAVGAVGMDLFIGWYRGAMRDAPTTLSHCGLLVRHLGHCCGRPLPANRLFQPVAGAPAI